MGPERYRAINSLLLEVLELPVEEREAHLNRATADDQAMRQEVISLLEADTGCLADLDRVSFRLLADSPDDASEDGPRRIGPYRIEREIGRGGMGVVYFAVRDDGELERQVAIKVLKRGMDSDAIVRRFRIERQVLANLEHPAIAELYDGGTTDDHRPYFVMEYVEGEPIDLFCDRNTLPLGERLDLFRKVCAAVEVAHRNLVVHCDLKPSNILITGDGEPKLLDFGIAKLLDPRTLLPLTLTAPGWRMMTPEYASPEQVKGDPVTTASDVYALGVLLYELLTGHRPYRFRSRILEEVRRMICETEPERPSTVVTRAEVFDNGTGETVTIDPETVSRARRERPRRLRRQLAGDLDNISLMALSKEAARRYPSVAALSEDVARYQRGLPVRARKDTVFYRAGKFLRRRRREVVAAALVVGLAVLALVDRLEQQTLVVLERDRAERVSRFLVDLFEVSDPYQRQQGQPITARQILDRGAQEIKTDASLSLDLRHTLMETIGEIYLNLGAYEPARPLLEETLARNRREHGDDEPQVARSLAALASLTFEQGDYGKAEQLYGEAHAIYRRLGTDDPSGTVASLNGQALAVRELGDLERAEKLHRQALDLGRRTLEPRHPEIAQVLNDLALLLLHRDELDASEKLFREALEIELHHFGPRHPRIESVMSNLASVLLRQNRVEPAEELFRQALDIAREVYGGEHPSVARNLNNLAYLRQLVGDLAEAETFYRQALAGARAAYGERHPNVARTLGGLANILRDKGDFVGAEDLLQLALAIQSEAFGPDHPAVASVSGLLGRLYLAKGDAAEAEAAARRAIEVFRRTLPPEHGHIFVTEQLLGVSLTRLGRFAEAEPLLLRGQAHLHETRGAEASETRQAVDHLVELYESWRQSEAASLWRARR